MPDSITEPPHCSEDVDHPLSGHGGGPAQHHNDHDDVHQGPEHEEGGPAHQADDEAAGEGEGGVTDPEHDHHSSDHMGAIRTSHKTLSQKNIALLVNKIGCLH